MLNQFLRYVVLGGVFLIPFLPFIVSSTMFFPFITGKNFTFRIIVELIFAAWLILALKDVAYRPRFTFIAAATAVFSYSDCCCRPHESECYQKFLEQF